MPCSRFPVPVGMFRVDLSVRPRPGVKDPQAEAVQESLTRLGHDLVTVDGVGRLLSLTIECESADEAEKITADLCDRLLVNPSLETYSVTMEATE
jgi:phosphoribosylformylglycinamidine synthase PurS subunit